jgi:hypothetical protein
MTITVYVWHERTRPELAPGHAYISWWPQKHALREAICSPALHHKMSEDIRGEYGLPNFVSAPIPNLAR